MNWKTLLAAGAILFSGTLYAQTPDGETPANEGVCDELFYATPGLYGLCIAYCEAQDIDLIDVDNPENIDVLSSSRAILDSYRAKMTEFDPDMPCLHPQCPCYTEAQAEAIAQSEYYWQCGNKSEPWINQFIQAKNPPRPGFPFSMFKWVVARQWEDSLFCQYNHYDEDLGINIQVRWNGTIQGQDEDWEAFVACLDIQDSVRNEFGLECQ